MAREPASQSVRSAETLRKRASNMNGAAFAFGSYATLAVPVAVTQAQSQLIAQGSGTSSLGVLVWWCLSGVIAGSCAITCAMSAAVLNSLTESAPQVQGREPRAE